MFSVALNELEALHKAGAVRACVMKTKKYHWRDGREDSEPFYDIEYYMNASGLEVAYCTVISNAVTFNDPPRYWDDSFKEVQHDIWFPEPVSHPN